MNTAKIISTKQGHSMNTTTRHILAAMLAVMGGTTQAADLLIHDVNLISAHLPEIAAHQHVLIRNGRIAEISATPIRTEPGVPVLDGRGKYLTPGLMDAHVHVGQVPGLHAGLSDYSALHAQYVQQEPRSYLYFGFTQVLSLAASSKGLADFRRQPQRPDLFRCGAAPMAGGYSADHAEADTVSGPSPVIIEAEQQSLWQKLFGPDAQAHSPEAVVQRLADSGADCVKVFIENGFGAADHLPLYSLNTLQRIRRAAHARGLPVFAHANAYDMLQIALDVPVDVLVHGVWNWTGIADEEARAAREQKSLPPALLAALKRVQAQGIGYQPTLQVMQRMGALFDAGVLDDPWLKKSTPAALHARYRQPDAQWFKKELAADFPGQADAEIAAIFRSVGARGAAAMKALHDAGHPLSLGSDTPSSPTYAHQPGYSSYLEMRDMAAAGVSLRAILEAATINNARLLKREADYGTLETGRVANLLLLSANPLENVEHWLQIENVVLHGEVHDREAFAAK